MAALDAKQGKPKKVKHPHLKALRSKLGSISRSKDKDGSGSTHAVSPHSEQVNHQTVFAVVFCTWCQVAIFSNELCLSVHGQAMMMMMCTAACIHHPAYSCFDCGSAHTQSTC